MDGEKLTWGRELPGELMERWPRDESGEYITPAFLMNCSMLDMGDSVITSMLESCGIPCLRRYPHYGGFGNLMLGMSAEGVELYVPETMLKDAKMLLNGEETSNEEL